MARDVRRGLRTIPKELSPKYFYDERGSQLFERITELDEYYPTRAEREILERALGRDRRRRRQAAASWSSWAPAPRRRPATCSSAMRDAGCLETYVPIDISEEITQQTAEMLVDEYPGLAGPRPRLRLRAPPGAHPRRRRKAPDRLPRRHDRQPLPLPAPLLHVPDRGADVPGRPLPARHRPDQGPGPPRGRLRRRRRGHRRVQQERARGPQPRARRRLRPRRLRARRPLRRDEERMDIRLRSLADQRGAARGHRPRRSSSPPARRCGPRSRPSSRASGLEEVYAHAGLELCGWFTDAAGDYALSLARRPA